MSFEFLASCLLEGCLEIIWFLEFCLSIIILDFESILSILDLESCLSIILGLESCLSSLDLESCLEATLFLIKPQPT